ncbi:family 43 glycosylhydrolase [Lachnospiraceae bacterium 29-84]
MKKSMRNYWNRICAMVLAAAMVITMAPQVALAGTSSMQEDGTFKNPVVYSDVPDIDMIRVGDTYYMISTTMHLSPGCPVMKSTDLVNWEIVNYVFDRLGTDDAMSLRNGKNMYGNGQWASSLQYHDGTYYVAFNSNTTGTAYIFTTKDIERGSWKKTTLNGAFHDMALFFDDASGKAYILYGGTQIRCAELEADLSSVKKETEIILFDSNADGEKVNANKQGFILGYEGTHIMKKDGYYYVFNICWPNGAGRTEVCHRSKTFPTTQWENEVILQASFQNNGVNAGVAQGGVIDTADGKWYGFMFQDHGAVGRVPVLTDCTWKNGWPMLGKDGDGKTVEAVMQLPVAGSEAKSIVKSDEFYNDAERREFVDNSTKQAASANETAGQAADAEAAPVAEAAAEAEEPAAPEIVEVLVNGNFESGTDGWEGFEGGNISVVEEGENHVLKVSGRANTSSSASQDVTGKIKAGQTYTIKGKIKYDNPNGPDEKPFNLMMQNGANYQYRQTVGSIKAKKGEWTEFEFTYTPGDSDMGNAFSTSSNRLFVETPWAGSPDTDQDLMDYYLDDLSMTYEKAAEEEKPPVADDSIIELIENGGFETGDTTGWQVTRTESGELEVTSEDKASGEYSMHIFNRQNCGAGACQDISGKLVMGKTYTISGKLKYTTGPATKQFYITIENGDNYNWRENLVSIHAKKGEWTSFTGTYTVHDKSEQFPFDKNQNFIFVETPWTANPTSENDLMDIWLDDFSMTTESDNMISNGSFEKGVEPWFGNEGAAISVTQDEAQEGQSSVVVTGRTGTGQGPAQDLSNKMTAGNTYTISAYVKYKTGPDKKTFNMTIQNGPDYNYRSILGSVEAKKGEWAKIDVKYTMPDDAITTQNTLFFETPWSADASQKPEEHLMDFYVDNVTMTEQVNEKVTEEVGENDYNGSNLDLVWQWNHNPNQNNWSLTARNGWLRLTTGTKVSSILDARNTLTQRTYGPTCSGRVKMDITNMKPGDVAGLSAFSYNYGYIAVKKEANKTKLVMVDASSNASKKEDAPEEKASVDCTETTVYLKEDFDFAGGDKVRFYYSFDGVTWKQLGPEVQLSYELTHFMGSRFALFNYATKSSGGYVDFDYFRVSDQITGESQAVSELKADMSNSGEISGVINSTCEAMVSLDALQAGNHSSLKASISVPDIMEVEDVVFQKDAIQGTPTYHFNGSRLTLQVTGKDISFQSADKLFATIKLKLKKYADKDQAATLKADYIMVDNGALEYDVTNCTTTINLKYLDTKALAKKLGYGNPLMTQEFGADPYAIVYDGRVYVYMTADDYQYDGNGNVLENNYGYIRSLRVISSDDMMNWTDHGEIKVAGEDGAAKWAAHSWAPAIAYKQIDGKDKFFLYFANDASGIGVLEGDSPLGPWKDPIGKALITRQTPGCQGVVWCFDPAVLVDDDGSAYIYFGGGVPEGQQISPKTARVAKLGEDMISIDGEAKLIDAPCMFEDSGIFKYNGKYYYNYCTNFIGPHGDGGPGYGTICYMESDDPMGPFTYKGEIFQNPANWFGVGGNNHHATFVFEGQSYFIYHAQTVSKALGIEKGYRSTHIDKISFRSDGSIKPIIGTYEGISQLRDVDAYGRIEAETIAWNAGIKVSACKESGGKHGQFNRQLTDLQNGDWAAVSQVNFGEKGAQAFQANIASAKGGQVEIRLDSPEGTKIGTLEVPATGGEDAFRLLECEVANVTGTRNVFLVFSGQGTGNLMNVDYYQFTEKEDGPDQPTKPDKTALEAKLTEAEGLLGKLGAEAKSKLEAAIQAARNVAGKEGVTQEEINEAVTALTAAVEAAKKTIVPDKPIEPDKPKVNDTFTASNGLKYKVKKYDAKAKEVVVTGASKQLTTLTIPSTVTYKKVSFKVTEIAKRAFKNQKKLTKATIGKYVKTIGSEAFQGAAKLAKVKFSGTAVKSIGKNAWKGIKSSASFDMKKTFTSSKGLKFKITKCTLKTKTVAVTGATKQMKTLSVPNTVTYNGMSFKVTSIGKKAFKNQKKLTSVTVGKYVTSIGSEAFSGASKLGKIKFNGTAVKSIGKKAFGSIKKNAVFDVKNSKIKYYKNLLKKANTKKFKVK